MSDYLGIIFPSQNSDAASLRGMLKWGNRVYALYSLALFWLIQWSFGGHIFIGVQTFMYLFFGQAAILMYVFQTYRRYFALPNSLTRNKYLYILSGLWLIIFIVFNFLQIVLSSVYAAEISFSSAWIITNAIPLVLAATGEYLYRRTSA